MVNSIDTNRKKGSTKKKRFPNKTEASAKLTSKAKCKKIRGCEAATILSYLEAACRSQEIKGHKSEVTENIALCPWHLSLP